jgi:hypothetical protein
MSSKVKHKKFKTDCVLKIIYKTDH